MFSSLVIKIAAGLAAVLILIGVGMWVAGWGPFHSPSAAAKAQPKVAAKVEKAGAAETAAVGKAEDTAKGKIAATGKRTEENVAKIRAAARNAPPADVPDAEFYRSVCSSELYAGSADCVGYRSGPQGKGAGNVSREVRRR